MDEHFELPVWYQEQEYQFPAEFHPYGYSYRIIVQVQDKRITFELDEERKYRAISVEEGDDRIDGRLLAAIVETLDELLGAG